VKNTAQVSLPRSWLESNRSDDDDDDDDDDNNNNNNNSNNNNKRGKDTFYHN